MPLDFTWFHLISYYLYLISLQFICYHLLASKTRTSSEACPISWKPQIVSSRLFSPDKQHAQSTCTTNTPLTDFRPAKRVATD